MRTILLYLVAFLLPLHSEEWRSDVFNCSLNLPSSPGWQPIASPDAPGVTVLVALQNPSRQAVFGLNILTGLPSTNLHDEATTAKIESMLHGFSYQFIGHSTVNVAGREWVQYPVRAANGAQTVTGVIRYTSDKEKVYGLSMLLGGGKEAAQDPELQAAAASFRLYAPLALATPVPAKPLPAGQKPPASIPAPASETTAEPAQPDYIRYGILIGATLLVLMIFGKIIGGNSKK